MLILIAIVILGVSIRAMHRRRARVREQEIFDCLVETIDLLLATLRAGYSLGQSVLILADVAPRTIRCEFQALREEVERGSAMTTALASSRSRLHPVFRPLVELLVSSIRLGIPTESLVLQIQTEARHVRRQQGETHARQLSVRLTMPVVLCMLPSFVFLIIIPMVAGTLTQLRLDGGTP